MRIKTSITFKEYCKLIFALIYSGIILKIIVSVGIAMLLWILGYYLHFLPVPKPEIYQYIALILIAVVQPSGIFWLIKRNYNSNNHLTELLDIYITSHEFNISGKTFYTELVWENIFKVEEKKNYFLVYLNTLSAIIISKNDLKNTEVIELKNILSTIPNIPVQLITKL
ncbi:MAG: YcxB family protein [Chitinophagales bacterium]|nr:YcxB family protein [Chitinophagales bacterium]